MKNADGIILEITKRIGEAVAPRVGKTLVSELMAITRVEARKAILSVLQEHGVDTTMIGKMAEGEVFAVREDPVEPGGVKVHLFPTVRAAIMSSNRPDVGRG